MHVGALASAALSTTAAASADTTREVQYGLPSEWIAAAPSSSEIQKPSDAAFRVIYQDIQERVANGTAEQYSGYRIKILKPEALALGNIRVQWSPSSGSATVHSIRIIRGGALIDVLKQAKLKTIEREAGLEQSILDGNLTATLQVPDLRVGDELEFAATVTSHESAFGNHNAGIALIPAAGLPGTYRYRLQWPAGRTVATRLTTDLPAVAPKTEAGFKTLSIEMHDPPAVVDVDGAPARYDIHRAVEYSDYAGWPELSRQMWPLFDRASQLTAGSPLRVEAAKIAASSSDPAARVEAALRLVQDQVRYVFVGLDGGNYIPATADDTWNRRFGDCKAKTALLMALLRELKIAAEPVVLNSKGGDGTNERLPNPELFDHVLIRAKVGGRDYWLDGTRLGDRHLDMIETPNVEWALPLRASGSDLVKVAPMISTYPQTISVVDIDSTAGVDKNGTWTVKEVVHGDDAYVMDTRLGTMSPTDADRAIMAYFRQSLSDVEPEHVSWHYDERHSSIMLVMKGKGKIDWDGDAKQGFSLILPGGGFRPPAKMERPKDQNQSAAWSVTYPKFRCYVTTVRLPPPTKGFQWTYRSKPVNRRLGGVAYWRQAGMRDNMVRTVMSSQSLARELTSAEATETNKQIPTFDNYMSSVEEVSRSEPVETSPLPFMEEPDWMANPAVCSAPAR